MRKYVQTLGNYIQKETLTSPEFARKLLSATYSWVRFSKEHSFQANVKNAYEYMTGAVAGTISDSFRHPEESVLVNVFFPCEVLHAMDLNPMLPEGISAYLANTACQQVFAETAEAHDVPETFCSYHKTMLGLAESGVMPRPLLVANTTLACDANQLSFRRLSEFYGVDQVVIDVPHSRDEEAVMYVADQLREMTPLLEDLTHKRLNMNKLKNILFRSQRTMKKYNEFVNRRGNLSLPTTMTGEMCSMIATHMMLGTPESEVFVDKLLSATGPMKPNIDPEKKRIFWVHTLPNWQESMVKIFESHKGCEIVGNDMAVDFIGGVDPDHPYETMAQRIVTSMYNGRAKNRIDTVLEFADRFNADAIVVFCHWGCKQTLGLSQMAKQTFEEHGYPTLILDGDGCDARNVADGQMITRVNAFIEQIGGQER